jgi:hypothetical protein
MANIILQELAEDAGATARAASEESASAARETVDATEVHAPADSKVVGVGEIDLTEGLHDELGDRLGFRDAPETSPYCTDAEIRQLVLEQYPLETRIASIH